MKLRVMKIRYDLMSIFLLCGIFSTMLQAQTGVPYAQQIAVIKKIKTEISVIGVLTTTMSDKSIEQMGRAATGLGVKIVLAQPKEASELPSLYKKLIKEKGAQILWIPDPSDKLMTGIGFEFLRENALPDRIGIIVPDQTLVGTGGLCNVYSDAGKLKAVVNQRIAQVVGATVPNDPADPVAYIVK